MKEICSYLSVFLMLACTPPSKEAGKNLVYPIDKKLDSLPHEKQVELAKEGTLENGKVPTLDIQSGAYQDSTLVDIMDLSDDFVLDMRYATDDNFLGERVYDCARCLVRYEVAKALLQAKDSLKAYGLRIKFFDCYRPWAVQKKMWALLPRPGYVANPYTSGSIHNRGAAVDVTLVDKAGHELNMGTSFDHFGPEARHGYTLLPPEVSKNRKLLKNIMKSSGFQAIRTEWWHYVYGKKYKFKITDRQLCP